MTGRRVALAALLLVAGVAAAAPPPRRNVLLVSVDSLRADRVGAYGNPRATTPTIDRLAAEGVRFAHATSPTSWTLPAHATLLSGLSQRAHGVITVGDRIPDAVDLLAERFARRGWETIGFFAGPFLHPAYGFGRGFEDYVPCTSVPVDDPASVEAARASHADRTSANVEAAFTAWLARRGPRPFFAFVHLWDVHYDYIPPAPYDRLFDPDYTGPLDGTRILHDGFPLTAPPRDVVHLLARYDGELRYTDDVLGRMLATLARAGALADTLVVVTADHGDEFLEHGGKGHQRTLYEEVLRVPLVLWAPGVVPRGRTVAAPVALEDVAPTILDLVGLDVPASVDGRSLRPLWEGRGDARPVVAELYAPRAPRLLLVAVRHGDRKVVWDTRKRSAVGFDLAADPHEQRPAAANATLLALARDRARAATRTLAARRDEPGSRAAPPPAVVDRLRALGYVH